MRSEEATAEFWPAALTSITVQSPDGTVQRGDGHHKIVYCTLQHVDGNVDLLLIRLRAVERIPKLPHDELGEPVSRTALLFSGFLVKIFGKIPVGIAAVREIQQFDQLHTFSSATGLALPIILVLAKPSRTAVSSGITCTESTGQPDESASPARILTTPSGVSTCNDPRSWRILRTFAILQTGRLFLAVASSQRTFRCFDRQ
jgi:hypothetical protein